MASTARAVSAAARGLPTREPASPRPAGAGETRPSLDVVDRRRAASQSNRRRAGMLRGLGVMFVIGALAVTAAAHTFVASDQQRIDTLQSQLTQTLAEQQDLQLSRAELESPLRVLAIAERRLGMVSPASVSYLPPVDPGPTVSQAGAEASKAALAAAAAQGAGRAKSAGSDGLGAKARKRPPLAGVRSPAITTPTR